MDCRKTPCAQCPWRRDVEPGQFPADRYDELAATTGTPGNEASFGSPIFACHKGSEENPMPCAGWLASVGWHSLTIRVAISTGQLPMSALQPGENWPPLYTSYEEMSRVQGGERGVESVCLNERCKRYYGHPQTVVPGKPCPGCRETMTAVERRSDGSVR